MAAAPFAAQAETWNIYGWQNHSWEFVDVDGGASIDRIQSNAGNIGFAASMDAGNGISVNVQCEQFMYVNQNAGKTSWCNRNSKIGLSHAQMGEIMFATWLLPYNEGVAQWVDPFYDAGADSHTSIMGSVGANTIFYNTGEFGTFDYTTAGAYDTGFNRRQENIIQYWSPNWNGFVFRFAWTAGNRDETAADAWNVGVFYTMPGGTELRMTYSEVDNDDNGTYGQGISGTGLGSPGAEIEMFAVGIVHWFD